MRTALLAVLLAALAGCGGGGGGGGGSSEPAVIPMDSYVLPLPSLTARASYTCSGVFRTAGETPETLTGSVEFANEGYGPTSPMNGLQAYVSRSTEDLWVAGQQYFTLTKSYGYIDALGRRWSLGGEESDGTVWWWGSALDYTQTGIGVGLVTGMVLSAFPEMAIGDSPAYGYPTITAVQADGVAPLFTQSGTSMVLAIEEIQTPLGRFEAFKVEWTSDKTKLSDGTRRVTLGTRWVRPDTGVLRAESTSSVDDGTRVVTMELTLELASHDP